MTVLKLKTDNYGLTNKCHEVESRNAQLLERLSAAENDLIEQQNSIRALKEENLNVTCDLRNTDKTLQNTKSELENAKLREVSLRSELDTVRQRNGELELLRGQLTATTEDTVHALTSAGFGKLEFSKISLEVVFIKNQVSIKIYLIF